MKSVLKANASHVAAAMVCSILACNANAGGTISMGDDKSVSVGFGMRTSFSSAKNAAPNGTSRSTDFSLDSARIFLGGSLNKDIKGMLNTEWDGSAVRIMDAAGMFSVTPELNIWVGRQLSPSDRANMAGPYYSLGGGYWAGVASRYGYNGGIFRARDDGVTAWGDVMNGKLGYSFGAYEGHTFGIGTLTQAAAKAANIQASDSLMYAGRVQYNFWDAEPGYYGTGNYLGGKDILSLGVAVRYQKDGVMIATPAPAIGTYSAYSIDFLMEKKIESSGAVSLEAAFYNYKNGGVVKSEEGNAYSAGAGFIFNKMGMGRPQPFVRFQRFAADSSVTTRQADIGMNYIVDAYNAQLSTVYSSTKVTSLPSANSFGVTLQLQF